MRYIAGAAAVVLAALAQGAASADTITTTIQVNHSGFHDRFDLAIGRYPDFDASLGTLTGVSFTFAGTFAPAFEWTGPVYPGQVAPPTVRVQLTPKVAIFPRRDEIALPTENLLAVYDGGYTATGTPEAFSITDVPMPLDLAPGGVLDELWAGTFLTGPRFAYGEPLADVGTLISTLAVTYSYIPADDEAPLPEPPALALLGVGLAGLLGAGWRGPRGPDADPPPR